MLISVCTAKTFVHIYSYDIPLEFHHLRILVHRSIIKKMEGRLELNGNICEASMTNFFLSYDMTHDHE